LPSSLILHHHSCPFVTRSPSARDLLLVVKACLAGWQQIPCSARNNFLVGSRYLYLFSIATRSPSLPVLHRQGISCWSSRHALLVGKKFLARQEIPSSLAGDALFVGRDPVLGSWSQWIFCWSARADWLVSQARTLGISFSFFFWSVDFFDGVCACHAGGHAHL